jgi:mono/diheme cytochrome c family protein
MNTARRPTTSRLRLRPGPALRSFVFGALLVVGFLSAPTPVTGQTAPKVDFERQVRPLFRVHCVKCHGPNKQRGALRLDRREWAAKGGESGRPILGGTHETNEILRRVTSDDIDEVMPKDGDRLTEAQIQTIRDWVAQRTPWPDEAGMDLPAKWWEPHVETISWYYDRYFRPIAIYLAAFFVLMLLCERSKVTIARGSEWARSRFERVIWWLHCVPRSWYLIGLLAIFLSHAFLQASEMRREIARLQIRSGTNAGAGLSIYSIFGLPPKPFRPDQPKQLGGEYYRGNCERSDKLFNRGNYRTATLRLSLHGLDHRKLQIGDAVPPDGLLIRFEIERAPHAAESLFTEKIMSNVFLSSEFYTGRQVEPIDQPVWLEAVEAAHRWAGFYRIPNSKNATDGELSGLVYVYKGDRDETTVSGEAHYGIKYDLKIANGCIAEGSDMWVGAIFWHGGIALPSDSTKVPFEEWFSARPIPEIAGPSSDDPRLLGIDDHPEARAAEDARVNRSNDSGPASP